MMLDETPDHMVCGHVGSSFMGEDGPPSLEYIKAKDLFPQKELVKEDDSLQVPFPALQGEGVEYLGRADEAVIAISNYRLHIKFKDSVINVPLGLIESVECRDMFQLHIICKDSKVVRCHLSTFKQCQEWVKRLNRSVVHPSRLEDLFALAYHAWCLGGSADDEDQHLHLCRPGDHVRHRMEMEVRRMGFDTQNAWRVSDINSNYKLCSSYPQKLLVPVWITDKELESVASFRSGKRIPVVVYRHQKNGAVIARCSQPEISWWGWRNTEDEYLVTSIAKACQMDPGQRPSPGAPGGRPRGEGPDSADGDFDSSLTGGPGVEDSPARQKLLILDARSYTAAVANRAKGGGCECEEYYPNCEVMFMGMANIHAIRNSFQALRAVCSQIPDPGNWLSALESTRWLQHLSVMLKAATLVCSGLEREGRPVLVHCSDGWDRTPQIVALAKVLLDPFYRTIEGFQCLVETEWLDYGHKFGDRCGHQENADDVSEQCPVFLQWLDCVHQLIKQFPCLFEFNEAFLVKLVQHTYSCLYGTFLCNNAREREARNIFKRTCSVWSLLRTGNKNFQNFLYIPSHEMVLQPVCHTRALQLWTAVYLPTTSPCTAVDDAMGLFLSPGAAGDELTPRPLDRLPKTRSMDNLVSAFENGVPLTRTSSDPNLNKHCLEGRAAPPLGSGPPESPGDGDSDSEDSEVEAVVRTPPRSPMECPTGGETRPAPCLTTQPLPSLALPPFLPHGEPLPAPVLQQALPQSNGLPLPPQSPPPRPPPPPPPPPPLPQEPLVVPSRALASPMHGPEAGSAPPRRTTAPYTPARTPAPTLRAFLEASLMATLKVNLKVILKVTLEDTLKVTLKVTREVTLEVTLKIILEELLALKRLGPPVPMEDSTETLTDDVEVVPYEVEAPETNREDGQGPGPGPQAHTSPPPREKPYDDEEEEVVEVEVRTEPSVAKAAAASAASAGAVVVATPTPVDSAHMAAQRLMSRSPLSDLALLGPRWESVQGMMQSARRSASHSGFCRAYQHRRPSGAGAAKTPRSQALAVSVAGPQCCCREGGRAGGPPPQAGWLSALSHAVPGGHALAAAAAGVSSSLAAHHQLLPAAHPSLPVGPPPAASPPPPQAYLDDDGLPVAMDAVQQRLRQMEACYKQEVELLRQQVRRLQMKLESKQYGSPPSEPDLDYEDDITCLRESDNSNEEDSLSSQSEDRLSEGSWDRVDQRDMEVTRWVPDHMASHCFNCDSEFWMAKRRHHCRNCGNVFCKDCCHLKLPIPDQQLYDPVLVCSTCYDQLLECRHRDLRSQQLKKPIATASS
ncbi:unnamed protein product [Arctogadus glacialis]